MKNSRKTILLAGLCALTMVFCVGCGEEKSSSSEGSSSSKATETATAATSESSADETSAAEATGLWKDAQYTEDTELGEGKTTVKVQIKADDKAITVTIHTDADNLGKALTENKLVEGDNSEYGLYIKVVNGIRADYDKDKAYWAISKNGELTPKGADGTKIADGEQYELTYTKG